MKRRGFLQMLVGTPAAAFVAPTLPAAAAVKPVTKVASNAVLAGGTELTMCASFTCGETLRISTFDDPEYVDDR